MFESILKNYEQEKKQIERENGKFLFFQNPQDYPFSRKNKKDIEKSWRTSQQGNFNESEQRI